jgi:hypothetical protein
MGKKPFDVIGYDLEEHYFHKLNSELIQKQRSQKETKPKDNVIDFKSRSQALKNKASRKAA